MWAPDQYLEQLYCEAIKRHVSNYNEKWKINLKAKFREALGEFPRNKEELRPIILEEEEMEDYYRLRVELTTIDPLRVPVYMLIPKNKKNMELPAILALHGHGYGSKEIVGLNPDGTMKSESGIHKNFAVDLVKRGVVVVAPELIGFGDRKVESEKGVGVATDNSCFTIASQLLLLGKTLAGLRVYECFRVIDYVISLKEVDNNKIGCMGLSGGGLVASFTTILDERIKATVISGYTNTFKGSIMARRHCLDNYIPGILQHAEMPELIGLIAPRPIFIEAGIDDPLFPNEHVTSALEKLKTIYKNFNASKSLSYDIFNGAHEISGRKSYDWLVDTL